MVAKAQISALEAAVSSAANSRGEATLSAFNQSSSLILVWAKHLYDTQRTGTADYMLEGFGALVRESSAYLALGLARAALFSLRGQVDLLFSWLYFKDHPRELALVQDTGDGYMLVSAVIKYLKEVFPKFGPRLEVLKQTGARSTKEPYRLLSGHVHGQSPLVIPIVQSLKDVVYSEKTCNEVIDVQRDCAEFMNDILLAIYLGDWASVPKPVQDAFNARSLTAGQRSQLFH